MKRKSFVSSIASRHVAFWVILIFVLTSVRGRGETGANKTTETTSRSASFSIISQRDPLLTLKEPMRFQVGDDPRWSDPNFDDSNWSLQRGDRNWRSLGLNNLSGLAWYRFELTLPAGDDSYSIKLPQIRTAYELFIDGKLCAAAGSMPPHARMYYTVPVLVPLPVSARAAPVTLHVALRVWQDPVWAIYEPGGPQGPLVVGRTGLMTEAFTHERLDRYWRNSDWFDLAILELFAGGAAFALFLLGRSAREYLWFCLLTLGCSSNHAVSLWARLHAHPVHPLESVESVFFTAYFIASLQFYRTLFAGKNTVAFRIAVGCSLLWLVNTQAAPLRFFPAKLENAGELLFTLPIYGWIFSLVLTKMRDRHPDAKLLALPVTMLLGTCLYRQFLFTMSTFNHPGVMKYTPVFKGFFYGDLQDIAEAFFLIAMLLILGQRFARTLRESDRTAAELEAARSVQRLLVPERLPFVPGMEIVTAYYPAQEVGGDFFQIIPLETGETIVVIGDVAGKGVPAALTVSLIVGVLQTLVDFVSGPGEILAGLNRHLHGRESAFATCLVLQFSPDRSQLVIANAGHLPAFADQLELTTESSLPLGILPGSIFLECVHSLRPGARIILLTDGVPEAMCKRELFGFERTQLLMGEQATTIAQAAKTFGQTDDITVLSIDLIAIDHHHDSKPDHIGALAKPSLSYQ